MSRASTHAWLARKDVAMSLRDAAAKMNISPSYLSDIENGKRDVSERVAASMQELYGINLHVHHWKCDCGETRDH